MKLECDSRIGIGCCSEMSNGGEFLASIHVCLQVCSGTRDGTASRGMIRTGLSRPAASAVRPSATAAPAPPGHPLGRYVHRFNDPGQMENRNRDGGPSRPSPDRCGEDVAVRLPLLLCADLDDRPAASRRREARRPLALFMDRCHRCKRKDAMFSEPSRYNLSI